MIDKIYSRKRIMLPNNKNNEPEFNINKLKNFVKVIVIFTIAFTVLFTLIRRINPMFNKLAEERTKGIATEIINIETGKVLKNTSYEELVNIEKDSNNNIQMLRVDVIKVNSLSSDIAYNIQMELNKKTSDKISIPFGSITGIKYLAGMGPRISIKINPAGSVETDFVSKFESAGINQTIHRLYLDVSCYVSIVTPYDIIETKITNQVLMGESVIVGNIPQTYLNLNEK